MPEIEFKNLMGAKALATDHRDRPRKLSVDETKWGALLAKSHALILYISI